MNLSSARCSAGFTSSTPGRKESTQRATKRAGEIEKKVSHVIFLSQSLEVILVFLPFPEIVAMVVLFVLISIHSGCKILIVAASYCGDACRTAIPSNNCRPFRISSLSISSSCSLASRRIFSEVFALTNTSSLPLVAVSSSLKLTSSLKLRALGASGP